MEAETGIHGENHRPVASHWQTLSHKVVSSTPRYMGSKEHLALYCLCTIWYISPKREIFYSLNCEDNNIFCLLCNVFSKRWLVYAAGTNTDVCARNYLYPAVFLLTKTQPRGFYQWIFIKDTPLLDWQDDQAQELGHAVFECIYNQ
jgi:hypothetical protein